MQNDEALEESVKEWRASTTWSNERNVGRSVFCQKESTLRMISFLYKN